MVSWGRSFKAALLLLAFTILWGILGIVIMFLGFFTGMFGRIFSVTPYPPYFTVNWAALGAGALLMIIGLLIVELGCWASLFKISTELIVEEVGKVLPAATVAPAATQAAVPPCPKCGTPLTYVQQYQRWYCTTCKEYQ